MLALGVRARQVSENTWPPHPLDAVIAMAAAYFLTGAELDERKALLWLESLPPPSLQTPEPLPRSVVKHCVPVNDEFGKASGSSAAAIQPVQRLARDPQRRAFARPALEEETVYLVWPDARPEPHLLEAVQSLCSKVNRIRHFTSLLQMWVAEPEEVGELTWVPDDDRAVVQLRVPAPGVLANLELWYKASEACDWASLVCAAAAGGGSTAPRSAGKVSWIEAAQGAPPPLRSQASMYHGYARFDRQEPQAIPQGTVFSPHIIVFRLERQSGPLAALGLPAALRVLQRWREALVSHTDDATERIREIISGHDPAGNPSQAPHLALIPLAFAGHRSADGHLLGVAAALPAGLDGGERRQVLTVLDRVSELRLGELGVWSLVQEIGNRPPWNLRPETWTAYPSGATHWSTVTPVAFDRHPKEKDRSAYYREAAEMIATACEAIGLPRPGEVVVTQVSAHLGVPPAHVFPRLQRKDGGDRRHCHAILIFDEPVCGPVLVGAGRYRGYGLCMPVEAM
jgi:CRISPR-associated protein Csb2